jgi:hypothetical protein
MDSALHQLMTRLDAQGFEVGIIDGALIVIAPPREPHDGPRLIDRLVCIPKPDTRGRLCYRGETRQTAIVTCEPRTDDGGTFWFFNYGRPVIEAANIIDAALHIGRPLMHAGVGR